MKRCAAIFALSLAIALMSVLVGDYDGFKQETVITADNAVY